MVFVKGVPLRQTMTYEELVPGTFFVDESTNMMFVSPGSSTNVASALIDVAKLSQTLSVSGTWTVNELFLRPGASATSKYRGPRDLA